MTEKKRWSKVTAAILILMIVLSSVNVWADERSDIFDPDKIVRYYNENGIGYFTGSFNVPMKAGDVYLYENSYLSDDTQRVYTNESGSCIVTFARDGSRIVIWCSLVESNKNVANFPLLIFTYLFVQLNNHGVVRFGSWAEQFTLWYYKEECNTMPFNCEFFTAVDVLDPRVSETMILTRK